MTIAEEVRVMTSNSLRIVQPREQLHRVVGGVDFGPRTFVIARSPEAILLWLGGHSWTVNGHRSYSGSHLCLIADRTRVAHSYKALKPDGGRLTRAKFHTNASAIQKVFGISVWDSILAACDTRGTLIIDGGGEPVR